MKNIIRIICLLVVLFLTTHSCSKKGGDLASQEKPEAKAEHDSKSGGIYKGMLVGSTGNFKIDLQDGKKEMIITVDGVTKTLPAANLSGWTSGQAISNAIFTDGSWSVVFSINADGTNPVLNPTIPGHPSMAMAALKETSQKFVWVFEGTYTGGQSGAPYNAWNFVITSESTAFEGLCHVDRVPTYLWGVYNNTTRTISGHIPGTTVNFTGSVTANAASGTWSEHPTVPQPGSGNFYGVKTM